MAKQYDGIDISLESTGDLSSYQYRFVKMTGTNSRVTYCSANTNLPIGVLQNKPNTSGAEALVRILGHSKVVANASLTAGNTVGTTNAGRARSLTVATNTTAYISGVVTVGASNQNELAEVVLVNFGGNGTT